MKPKQTQLEMFPRNVRNSATYKPRKGTVSVGKSQTVQDESDSVNDLMTKAIHGMPLTAKMRNGQYEEEAELEGLDKNQYQYLDLTEQDEIKEYFKGDYEEKHRKYMEEVEERRKASAEAAEAKRLEATQK
jgi:vacuolar-type H+-ATPase subunit I/STV1